MAFYDGLFNAINNANPLHQGASVAKWVIGAVLILVIFLMIWIAVLAKGGMSAAPADATAARMYGVIPGWGHAKPAY